MKEGGAKEVVELQKEKKAKKAKKAKKSKKKHRREEKDEFGRDILPGFTPPTPRSPSDFRHALYMIGKTEGIRGLQSGLVAGMAYNVVMNGVRLGGFGKLQQAVGATNPSDPTYFLRNAMAGAMSAAAVSGLVVTTCMHPFDVVATRLSNQPVVAGRGQLYSGVVDCLRKIWATEGLRGLCKGWTAHYFRVGPHTMFTFVLWEQLQRLAHEVAGL
ncbi:hypothetical protein B5M09_005748 [Aphanomyces astaci]|uniref:Mitochondrial carrier protein n=1 Tax=Aphanomyces astaci TaxID=112090 RepID=A0A425DK41_APHAT|nr:hypothetical protein B5M09_005748 [Aphanomyces astaci]